MKSKTVALLFVIMMACLSAQSFALPLEDFESYTDTAALQAQWPILPATQTTVSTSLSTSVFHAGAKSMRYNYDCSVEPYYSRVFHVFPSDQDWSAYNILSFWLKGESSLTNSSEYVIISLYKLVGEVYNDPNDLELIGTTSLAGITQDPSWKHQQANIQVGYGDRSAVRAISIGLDPHALYGYGDGVLWFDDLEVTSASLEPLEDFESYADTTELLDFGTNDGNGGGWSSGTSTAVLSLSTTEVYEGLQAMRFDYNNGADPYYAKAMKWLAWSSGDGFDMRPYDILSISFKCTDASDYLQAVLVDGDGINQAVIQYNGTTPLPVGDWVKWQIDLSTIPNEDKWMVGRVDLVMKGYYGSGTVYFDDIHLNVCVLDIPGDVDGNCRVNQQDLAKFASYWLDNTCVADTWCDSCDIDQSGEVDLIDFAVLANHYGECNLLVQEDCD
ncbi:MAG: dockerin type I repeat-containing protein [Sedimentisphaerales bacterium]|nr:dockerin type I repeat-containing protein [Sedimentisphaerales bacterium]